MAINANSVASVQAGDSKHCAQVQNPDPAALQVPAAAQAPDADGVREATKEVQIAPAAPNPITKLRARSALEDVDIDGDSSYSLSDVTQGEDIPLEDPNGNRLVGEDAVPPPVKRRRSQDCLHACKLRCFSS